jgi:hypothetical protein
MRVSVHTVRTQDEFMCLVRIVTFYFIDNNMKKISYGMSPLSQIQVQQTV